MTLQREGWIDDRPYAVLTDMDTGRAAKFRCLKCDTETEPDAAVFASHRCRSEKKRS